MYYGDTSMFSPELFRDSWIELANFAAARSRFILETLASYE
jgi:hypothetical protein